jgi:hypothetical protein
LVEYGMAHFVIFNTETDFGNGLVGPEELGGATGLNDGPFRRTMNQQIEFLKEDLASVDRRITRESSRSTLLVEKGWAAF